MSKNGTYHPTPSVTTVHERALILTWAIQDLMQLLQDESEAGGPLCREENGELASSMRFQLEFAGQLLDGDVNYMSPESLAIMRRLVTLLDAPPDSILGKHFAEEMRTARLYRTAPVCV